MTSFILRAHVLYCRCCSGPDPMGSWGDSEYSCPGCGKTIPCDEVRWSNCVLNPTYLRRSILEDGSATKAKRRIMKYLTFLGRSDSEVYDRGKVEDYYQELQRSTPIHNEYKLFRNECWKQIMDESIELIRRSGIKHMQDYCKHYAPIDGHIWVLYFQPSTPFGSYQGHMCINSQHFTPDEYAHYIQLIRSSRRDYLSWAGVNSSDLADLSISIENARHIIDYYCDVCRKTIGETRRFICANSTCEECDEYENCASFDACSDCYYNQKTVCTACGTRQHLTDLTPDRVDLTPDGVDLTPNGVDLTPDGADLTADYVPHAAHTPCH